MSSAGAGVEVAPGDPGEISQAAAWHQELADELELHRATITGATSAVLATWNGEAASSYARLATIVADHFIRTADDARTVASSLFRYSGELERCQQQGMHALGESEHWLLEQNKWQTKLDDANRAVAAAEQQVRRSSTAAAGLPAAHAALVKAQNDQLTAQKQLRHAEHEVLNWQAIGRRAWDEAIDAATQATGAVKTINVAPPPLAGWPRLDRFNTPSPDRGPGSPAGPNGATSARVGDDEPPPTTGYRSQGTGNGVYRSQGTGNGGSIYIPTDGAAHGGESHELAPSSPTSAAGPAGGQAGVQHVQAKPPVTPSGTSISSHASGAIVVGGITIGELTQIGKAHGWQGQEINDWASLCKSESNGTVTDTNPSSGAYGIAQFINGPSEYAQYGGNANTVSGQLQAMANYIAQRYGNPSAAWSFHLAHNWY